MHEEVTENAPRYGEETCRPPGPWRSFGYENATREKIAMEARFASLMYGAAMAGNLKEFLGDSPRVHSTR